MELKHCDNESGHCVFTVKLQCPPCPGCIIETGFIESVAKKAKKVQFDAVPLGISPSYLTLSSSKHAAQIYPKLSEDLDVMLAAANVALSHQPQAEIRSDLCLADFYLMPKSKIFNFQIKSPQLLPNRNMWGGKNKIK